VSLVLISVIILAPIVGWLWGKDEVADMELARKHDGGIVGNVVSVALMFLFVWFIAVDMGMPHEVFWGLSLFGFGLLTITKRLCRNYRLKRVFPLTYLAPNCA